MTTHSEEDPDGIASFTTVITSAEDPASEGLVIDNSYCFAGPRPAH